MANKKSVNNRWNSRNTNQECGIGMNCSRNYTCKRKSSDKKRKRKIHHQLFMNEDDYRLRLQEVLYSPEYILTKIFRADGPPLGDEFDSLPSNALLCKKKGPRKCIHACDENPRVYKRRKACQENSVSTPRHGMGKGLMTNLVSSAKKHGVGKGLITKKAAPAKKHGIGKGLMTVLQLTNPDAGDFSSGVISRRGLIQKKKKSSQLQKTVLRKLSNKGQAKRKLPLRRRNAEYPKVEKQKQPRKEKCELASGGEFYLENAERFAMLIDDEELELRELQAGPNPLTCSAHFATNGSHGCSLCKDLLAKFPPNSVTMKLPLYAQPWDSSPELVKKLFKVFHFLCTYAVTIDICSFTLEEFAQAFHDKESLLLGQVHVALLKLLVSDVNHDLSRGYLPHASKNHKFLALLHSVEGHDFVLDFWQKSLNLLTWTEILRQVLAAAGHGSKIGMTPKGVLSKESNLMAKYGLNSGTLKGELFNILLTQGSGGMKVSELAKSSSIVDLNLVDTTHELENLISSALSSDITLFEKISSSGYRLRISASPKEEEVYPSDSEDFGSVDEISEVSGGCSDDDSSKCEYMDSSPAKLKRDHCKNKNNMLTVYNEIDESHPGEAWLLGLMEGEYSDLSIEEKLNALVALTDLLSAGSSIRTEDFLTPNIECAPNISHCASGGKIKRATVQQCNLPGQLVCSAGKNISNSHGSTSEQPIDSLVLMSVIGSKGTDDNTRKDAKEMKAEDYLHPMQSIFLGSDRRYNRYWIFLGPCDEFDPGHKRIYFESSEDGHWEVIDTQEALCTLLSILDHRGAREAYLLASLETRKAFLCQAMSGIPNDGGVGQPSVCDGSESNPFREDSSSPVSDVDNQLTLTETGSNVPSSTLSTVPEVGKKEHKDKWNSSQAFGWWIWKSFYSELNSVRNGKRAYIDSLRRCEYCHDLYWRDEKHCEVCHTTFGLDFDIEERYAVHSATCRDSTNIKGVQKQRVLSSQLQALKAAIYAIETVLPDNAFVGPWRKSAHNLWVSRLRRSSSLVEFLQVLADFVTAISEDWFYQFNGDLASNYYLDEVFASFTCTPQTSSAVALWLVKLDLLVAPYIERDQSQNKSRSLARLKGTRYPDQ